MSRKVKRIAVKRTKQKQQGKTRAIQSQKRLKILSEDEVESLFGPPRFGHEERTKYFSLSRPEKQLLRKFRSVTSRACFVLQLGYFKAKRQFFSFDTREAEEDLRYVLEQHFSNKNIAEISFVDRDTRVRQQYIILDLFGYRNCNAPERRRLEEKARQAATVCGKPLYVFGELTRFLEEERIVSPEYSSLQDIVGAALTFEQNRLAEIMRRRLTPSDREALRDLLHDSEGLHEITRLKRDPRDFTYSEIKREVARGEKIRDLYRLTQKLLPELNVSNESVRYYASLVLYYSVYRLKRFDEDTAFLYLLCFAYHRFQRFHDNMLSSLLHHVREFSDDAKTAAQQRVYDQQAETNQNLQKAGEVLKLFTDDDIRDDVPFREAREKAFTILERKKLESVANRIAAKDGFDETAFEWEHIDRLGKQFKYHLRPVVTAVDFTAVSARKPLMEAVAFLKEAFRKGKALSQYTPDAFPTTFIPENAKRYLFAKDAHGRNRPIPDRYEFLVYRQLKQGLEAVDISCRDSIRFRSFEDDLVDGKLWRRDKEKLIAETGSPILKTPIREHLAELKRELEEKIAEVNRRIESGENEHFRIKRHGRNVRWTLQGLPASEPVNHPVFGTLGQTDIADILRFVHGECGALDTFDHVLGRYAKQDPDHDILIACLIAWGTNLWLWQMGEISDIPFHILASVSDSFIRPETLKAANDIICNAIAKLSIFRQYDIDKRLHSSSDGQKFETRVDTINARHSPKYFGLGKGIVSNNLVINHLSPNAKIIGANEHESRYLYDLLKSNTTDIVPEIHSTDSHGINAVNFAILNISGYQFAPRYKDIREKAGTSLYGFQHPTKYDEGWLLRPVRKINEDLIVEEWENFQRIMVSLDRKTTTQGVIVGKLSSHARKNKTKRAIWEYDHIIESLHLLNYVDCPVFRKNVHRALNRGESYHQLRRAISHANFGKLRFKTEYEQEIWNECARLISNGVIFYNATILSRLWEYRKSVGDHEGAAEILNVSPVAWIHLNFRGRYKFRNGENSIDIDAIVQKLAQEKELSGHSPQVV